MFQYPGKPVHRAVLFMIVVLGGAGFCNSIQAQQKNASLQQGAFSGAEVRWSSQSLRPEDIRMSPSRQMEVKEFFAAFRNTFQLPEALQFIPEKELTGPEGFTHIRHTLYYKDLELAEAQFIMHLREGRVVHAHGTLPDLEELDVTPSLSRREAFESACNALGLSPLEARRNAGVLAILSAGRGTGLADGRLTLSRDPSEKQRRNYKLAYRFDMTILNPIQRYHVDIDAHTGELIGKYPALFHENIPAKGKSLYNDTVDIIVSDSTSLGDWGIQYSHWHLSEWNAFRESGESWWMADTSLITPGGYDNNWLEALVTDPIVLSGSESKLRFVHRYNLENPEGAADYNHDYDGWDGINVRISSDHGITWSVLEEPVPAYTCTSLWSFGGIHNEGPGIPGWAGNGATWTQVEFDLTGYLNDTVLIRFDFASDGGFSSLDDTTLFGWQVDDIAVSSDNGILFSNAGEGSNMTVQNLFQWVGSIEGRFRLRETTRGNGIATINAGSGEGFAAYVDYVQETLPFSDEENKAGVGIHWATEKTYDYFLETFHRNSYDDKGGSIISYADWMIGDEQFNAFWSGNFAAYGAGDDETGSFGTVDVVGHEITHGVTQYSANLVYQGESGALNESFSDIFGTAVEFFAEGEDKGDWLIGEDIFGGQRAIRSMENPKRFSDPDTYLGQHWIDTEEKDDFGGVHTNSGVQNHWFYLLSEGGAGMNDDNFGYEVEGIGLENAASIAYRNLTIYLVPESGYADAVRYSIQSAEDLFGEDSPQVESTMAAWEAAGIYPNHPLLVSSDTLLQFVTPVDASNSATITLTNKGLHPLTIQEFNVGDTLNYELVNPPALPLELNGLDHVQLEIKFTPAAQGIHPDTIVITGTDSGDFNQVIYLSGEGISFPTGLPASSIDAGLIIYPNPVNNLLTIETHISDTYYIEILTLGGQPVLLEEMRGTTAKLDLSPFRRGVYFIHIRSAELVATRKIIKL